MKRILGCLITTAIAFSSHVAANNAHLCATCSTESSALEFAIKIATNQANTLVCSPHFDSNIQCHSRNKEVTVIDESTGNAYRFNVYQQLRAPWAIKADRLTLSSDAQEAYRILVQFHEDLNASIEEASGTASSTFGASANDGLSTAEKSKLTAKGNTPWDSACPTDTALATLLDPNKLSDARTEAQVAIGNPRTESYILNFSESERPSSIFDRLVFSVDVVGYDTNDTVIASFEINEGASRVAGYSLSSLRGNNKPLLIDNACIEKRFEQAAALGIVAMTSTDIESDSPVDENEGFPLHQGESGSTCKLKDFYQGQRRKYSYRVCDPIPL